MKSTSKATTKYIIKHIRQEWKLFTLVILGITLDQALFTIQPLFYKKFVDELTSANVNYNLLTSILITILGINIVVWFVRRLFDVTLNLFEPKVMKKMLDEAHQYIHRHSFDFFINNFGGSLVKRVNRLASGFERIIDRVLFNFIPIVVKVGISIYLIQRIDISLGLILGAWVFVFILVNYIVASYKMKLDNRVNEIDSRMSGTLADNITNNFNITLFATHAEEQGNYESITSEWRRVFTKSWTLSAMGDAILAALMIALEFILFYFGLQYFKQGKVTVGDFILIQSLLLQIFDQLWMIGKMIRDFGRGYSEMREMIEILELPHEIKDKPNSKDLIVVNGEINIKNLTFKYTEDKNVFENFSLLIEPKRKIALVSKSGGGKSTLVKLLLRLYEVPENTVFIDGQDITKATLDSVRKSISLVPQDPVLFHRTLRENISYGKPEATMEEIIEASKKAHCHEFITQLKDGYETYVGERGIKLSGGERQRVAIARAILEDAPILILDEATSALDSESEMLIKDALHELMKNKTTIAIAHRLSTIIEMDEIIVFEEGKIIERGSHQKLLREDSGKYKRLWEIQAGGFS